MSALSFYVSIRHFLIAHPVPHEFPFPVADNVEGMLVYLTCLTTVATLASLDANARARGPASAKPTRMYDLVSLAAIFAVTSLITWMATGWQWTWVTHAVLVAVVLLASNLLFRFHMWMQVRILASVLAIFLWPFWSVDIIGRLDVSDPTRTLFYVGMSFSMLRLPFSFGTLWVDGLCVGRRLWVQPRNTLPHQPDQSCPKVSIQIPCYSEPPDVVISTLEAVSNVDYPKSQFEVIIVDNNTVDESLWKPVEEWCKTVGGPQFRFFHECPLAGAKPGAQNYALERMDGELILCLDADFIIQPDFLRRTVGFFVDKEVAAVQTTPDFRGRKDSTYMGMIYWFYMMNYRVNEPVRNEIDSAYLVGSVNLIRKSALVEVGRWAEWAVTEDTELSMRLNAAGYRILCIPVAMSNGLMPDNFDGFRKQWFRWTIGNYQQLRHNWRLLLPNRFGHSKAGSTHKYFEFVRCVQPMVNSLIFVTSLVMAVVVTSSIIYNGDFVDVPMVVYLLSMLSAPSGLTSMMLYIRQAGGGWRELVSVAVVGSSMTQLFDVALWKGLFSRTAPKWTRTSKFNSKSSVNWTKWLSSVSHEWLRGVATMIFAGYAVYAVHKTQGAHAPLGLFVMAGAMALLAAAFTFVVTPLLMVILAHKHAIKREAPGSNV